MIHQKMKEGNYSVILAIWNNPPFPPKSFAWKQQKKKKKTTKIKTYQHYQKFTPTVNTQGH